MHHPESQGGKANFIRYEARVRPETDSVARDTRCGHCWGWLPDVESLMTHLIRDHPGAYCILCDIVTRRDRKEPVNNATRCQRHDYSVHECCGICDPSARRPSDHFEDLAEHTDHVNEEHANKPEAMRHFEIRRRELFEQAVGAKQRQDVGAAGHLRRKYKDLAKKISNCRESHFENLKAELFAICKEMDGHRDAIMGLYDPKKRKEDEIEDNLPKGAKGANGAKVDSRPPEEPVLK
ncbi:MAG: hypothetical protein Q9227_007998 [Pyrenula ochraceoflavens]